MQYVIYLFSNYKFFMAIFQSVSKLNNRIFFNLYLISYSFDGVNLCRLCTDRKITLTVGTLGNGNAVGAASKLISVTRASLEIGSAGGGKPIRTATVRRILTAAALIARSARRRRIIRTTAKSRVLAAAAVEVWSTRRQNVIRTAFVRGR